MLADSGSAPPYRAVDDSQPFYHGPPARSLPSYPALVPLSRSIRVLSDALQAPIDAPILARCRSTRSTAAEGSKLSPGKRRARSMSHRCTSLARVHGSVQSTQRPPHRLAFTHKQRHPRVAALSQCAGPVGSTLVRACSPRSASRWLSARTPQRRLSARNASNPPSAGHKRHRLSLAEPQCGRGLTLAGMPYSVESRGRQPLDGCFGAGTVGRR